MYGHAVPGPGYHGDLLPFAVCSLRLDLEGQLIPLLKLPYICNSCVCDAGKGLCR